VENKGQLDKPSQIFEFALEVDAPNINDIILMKGPWYNVIRP
jgi:hypothetical protein